MSAQIYEDGEASKEGSPGEPSSPAKFLEQNTKHRPKWMIKFSDGVKRINETIRRLAKMNEQAQNAYVRDPLKYTEEEKSDSEENPAPRGPRWIKSKEEIYSLGGESDSLGTEGWGGDLKDYLLYQGLMLGMGSDVTVVINGEKSYKLHRFILSQASMFREAFYYHEMGLPFHWDALDDFVDIEAVEHIINRLYGNFGDKYYEAKNLIPIMAICIQWGLVNWFHGYLDRFMSRLSVETLFDIIDFAMDDFYGDWVEPHILPVIKHYMAHYGAHLGINAWRALPIDWIVQILSYDGFIFSDNDREDVRKDLGYCSLVMGHEYERWCFARNIYYDRLGVTAIIREEMNNGVLPDHITQELIEEQRPLFEFLNSQKFQYCNMNPISWRPVRSERLLGVSDLIRPDVLADGVFDALRLRRVVEDAPSDDTHLSLQFPMDDNVPDNVETYEVPMADRYLYRPRRIELLKDPDPVLAPRIGEDGQPIPAKPEYTVVPPVRFSVEFQFHRGIGAMNASSVLAAEPVFYGGSWWLFSINKTRNEAEPAERINMHIRRLGKDSFTASDEPNRPSSSHASVSRDSWSTFSDVNFQELAREHLDGLFRPQILDDLLEGTTRAEFYEDKREVIKAYVRIYAPSWIARYDPEKVIEISGTDFPKMRAPAITRTTICECKPMEFRFDTDYVIPGRLLIHEVEEAEELKDFVNDSGYFQGKIDKIMEGEPIKLPTTRDGIMGKVYAHTGEVDGAWDKEGGGGPDGSVLRALHERDTAWADLKFGIVIGLV